MNTRFGPTVDADQFHTAFNEVVDEFVAKGHLVVDSFPRAFAHAVGKLAASTS